MSDKDRCEPTVTSWVTSAALSESDSDSTRNVTPRPTAAAAVIRASCPPPTMPTTGIPVPDLRAMGPAGPAGDNGESTPCSLRGTTQSWVQPTWRHEAAASRHPPASSLPPPGLVSQARRSSAASYRWPCSQQGARMTALGDDVEVREGTYGDRVIAVEPGGAEFIPLSERHGRPLQLFWTWTSPNMEFATIFVGILGVAVLGLSFWATFLAIVLGTLLGSVTMGVLSASGPRYGVPQMVLSRRGFGYWGNILPAGLNSLAGGIGWFAVNSVSGALALASLTHIPQVLCLLIVVVVQL